MIYHYFYKYFTHFSVVLNNAIEIFIEFSKHMGYPVINSELPTLEESFGELGEDKLVVRRVYRTDVCHGTVPVVYNKFSLRIDI